MTHPFDPGYGWEPFRTLCEDYPDETVYPSRYFRTEWGPIFHRGRLDNTARVLVIGQDPAQHEGVVRRILVGEAGRRVQGFLAKLGVETSYVMINTFLYSVYGTVPKAVAEHPGLVAYRNRWLDALLGNTNVEAVVTLGQRARQAWELWEAAGSNGEHLFGVAHVTHPTQPESSSKGDPAKRAAAMAALLAQWNQAITALRMSIGHPDVDRPFVPYGADFLPEELVDVPACDFPAGLPDWMRLDDGWAKRSGETAEKKRRTITITVPAHVIA